MAQQGLRRKQGRQAPSDLSHVRQQQAETETETDLGVWDQHARRRVS